MMCTAVRFSSTPNGKPKETKENKWQSATDAQRAEMKNEEIRNGEFWALFFFVMSGFFGSLMVIFLFVGASNMLSHLVLAIVSAALTALCMTAGLAVRVAVDEMK